MLKQNKSLNKQRHHYQSLVATALLTGSFFQFVAPVLADGTSAGTSISNTATATYEDPNSPGSPINSTSNTVTVILAEVAGITVTGSGIANQTTPGGSTKAGDTLVYTYTVTNVGNDLTKFQIPNLATTTGPATVSGILPVDKNGATPASGNLQYSTDGGATWTNIPAGGLTTAAVAVNGSVLVRVPVTVQAGAQSGDTITVRLGQTPGDAQNQPRIADGGDVFTVDNNNPAGAPVNGVREASATQQIQVGNTPKSRALATILKTKTAYDNAGTSGTLIDDLLTYGLSLRVESNDVTNTGITPAPLTGTNITVDGTTTSRILISDAIPANTVLKTTPIAPSGWKVVYTTTTTSTNAEAATWTTSQPALNLITRVGFINDPTLITSVATGTTVNGFSIQVQTTGASGNGPVAINNIAQVVGTTAGDPTSKIYDNSGDQNPDNFNSTNSTFPTTTDAGFVPNGTVVPANQTDAQNNNTGTNSPTGDVNVTTLSVPNASSVLNGPNGVPDAVGPTNNNDDFTNKSALIPPNSAPGSTVDPAAVSFTNTVQNTGTSPSNISLVPTPPATAGDLPTNTVVTVSYQGLSATYTYNGTIFVFTSSVGTVGGNPISATNPVRIDGVAANGGKANYGVSVDLPANTPLSTDTNAQGAAVTTIQRGFPTPITAFIDANNNGSPDDAATNISIDRVYTGFLQLLKESRVLQGTGPALSNSADGTFSITPKKPAPGNIIEYRITYKNISTPQVGSGNVILSADKIVITEDGTQTPNNWAKDNDNNSQIDTSNIVSSAKDSGTSTIQFFSGNPATNSANDQTGTTANTDVTKYVDAVTGQVAPGVQRTFTFQRKVN
ncbi:beta strand repeat-containing protein [Nostoc sp. C117]|uniref:beta strand repeat-containing protein n=1 Tax=Nostoc sp. C117 TaxID=3349875 RepID=UPI00370D7726